jgi:sec-independent protein translocase protein TatA
VWGLGFWDLLIIAFVVLLIFGPKRLPQMGRSVGSSIKGFKDAVTDRVDKQDAEADAEAQSLQAPTASPQPAELPPAPPVAGQPAQPDPRERDTVL